MRFGISSTIVKDRNLIELIEVLKDEDIKNIELRCEKNHIAYEDKLELKRLKDILRNFHINVVSVHPPDWIDIGSENEHIRIKSVREAEKCILVAKHLGAFRIIIHPSNSKTEFSIITCSIEEIKEFGDENNIEILLENNIKPKSASDLKELKDLADIFDLYICFDTSHYFSFKNEFEDIKNINGRIRELHISDSNMCGDDDHLFPGEGKIDWERFYREISLNDKDVIFELKPTKDIILTMKRIKEYINRIENGYFSK